MTELGLFGADEDQDKCVREKPGDYCMKSGNFVNKGSVTKYYGTVASIMK